MDFEIIRENFDRIRREKGLKMKDLAGGLHVTPQSIYSTINGKNITVGTLQKIADLLGVDAFELLKPNEPNPRTNAPRIMCPYCGKPLILSASIPETNEDTTKAEK